MVETKTLLEKYLTEKELGIISEAYQKAEEGRDIERKKTIYRAIKDVESMCKYLDLAPVTIYTHENFEILAQKINILRVLVNSPLEGPNSFRFITQNDFPKFLRSLEFIDEYYYPNIYNLLNNIANGVVKAKHLKSVGNIKILRALDEYIEIYYARIKEYLILISASRRKEKGAISANDLSSLMDLTEDRLNSPIQTDYMRMVESQLNVYEYGIEDIEIKKK